jgi:RimJ/RimL family protein N-acetyltransferase
MKAHEPVLFKGNLRQRFSFDGRFEDERSFGLLRDEWRR